MAKRPAVAAPRIAVDTNYILDCYDGDEVALAAWEMLMGRALRPVWIIPPTAGQELFSLARDAKSKVERERFTNAARSAVEELSFQPLPLASVQHGIADRISVALRRKGIIPEEERNDSLILAEAALLACEILITKDEHLVGADRAAVRALLLSFDCTATVVVHPAGVMRTWK